MHTTVCRAAHRHPESSKPVSQHLEDKTKDRQAEWGAGAVGG